MSSSVYTDDAEIPDGKKFMAQGLRIAAGVPLQVDEPADFKSFRIGLFGLDKLRNLERTVASFERGTQRDPLTRGAHGAAVVAPRSGC